MKITRALAKEIRFRCCEAVGRKVLVEVGCRDWSGKPDEADGFNFLLWGRDHDLWETVPAHQLAGTAVQDSGGWVALDCYCYTPGPDGELYHNAYLLIDPAGEVVYASDNDLRHSEEIDAILRANGHPGYQYED
jgi:hypothetical protein